MTTDTDEGSFAVLVTGATRGIGEGCARQFAEHGASVTICSPEVDRGHALAEEITGQGGGRCIYHECDVRDPTAIRATIGAALGAFGHLDCLVNNAGVPATGKTLEDTSLTEINDLVLTNLTSCIVASRYALPALREARGSIVNIGSLAGTLGHDLAAVYSATKGGIASFTKALAIEEAGSGVRVNVILPGNILTESRRLKEAASSRGAEYHDFVESWQWLGRSGTPEEVGNVCRFLASPEARYLTGVEIVVSGGAELGFGPKYRNSFDAEAVRAYQSGRRGEPS